MNIAEWILVAILSITLFIFLIVGIVLIVKLIGLTKDAQKVVIKSQDIAENANGIVNNVKGMTSIGGTVEMFVDKYINPKLKEKMKEKKEEKKNDGKE
ncbi:hypothetical protein IJG01_03665 [Candidatus Saccharibacteria bacterium]|nr:hypothetical protein [Candidatus Saccharibacteria bacterium]